MALPRASAPTMEASENILKDLTHLAEAVFAGDTARVAFFLARYALSENDANTAIAVVEGTLGEPPSTTFLDATALRVANCLHLLRANVQWSTGKSPRLASSMILAYAQQQPALIRAALPARCVLVPGVSWVAYFTHWVLPYDEDRYETFSALVEQHRRLVFSPRATRSWNEYLERFVGGANADALVPWPLERIVSLIARGLRPTPRAWLAILRSLHAQIAAASDRTTRLYWMHHIIATRRVSRLLSIAAPAIFHELHAVCPRFAPVAAASTEFDDSDSDDGDLQCFTWDTATPMEIDADSGDKSGDPALYAFINALTLNADTRTVLLY